MMHVDHLSFSFRGQEKQILEDISFSIRAHEITSVIGPNGSGKSTLFRCLTGQYTPEAGEVILQGKPLSSYSGRHRAQKLAMVYQHHPNIAGVTVRELVESGRTPYQTKRKERQKENQFIENVLEWTDLIDLQSRRVERLSGGQRQRVWLAQALAQQPDILLLDEPNTFLDIEYQVELLDMLKFLNEEEGLTICMIMHDLTQVMDISDRVIALNDGKVYSEGTPEEVLTEETIEQLFGVHTELVRTSGGNTLIHYLGKANDKGIGKPYRMLETKV